MKKYIELFAKLGIELNAGNETANLLHVNNQRYFQSNLLEHVNKSTENLSNVKDFLTEYFENETNFLLALLPTRNTSPNSHSSNQDNLIRLLVELKPLQAFIFDFLAEQICMYCSTGDVEKVMLGNNMDPAIYCIDQFKYIPRVYEPKNACDKLLDLVTSLSDLRTKREVIRCFPDVMGDCEHGELVDKFGQFLGDADLVGVTLETVMNMGLDETNMEKIVGRLFANYGLINEADIPAVVNFIIKSASDLKSVEMYEKLRGKLRFEQIKEEKTRMRIFECIRDYFFVSISSVELFFAFEEKFLTEMKNCTSRNMKPLDFIIFAVIYSMHFKEADRLFKQILKDENNSKSSVDDTLNNVFKLGPLILKELVDPILLVSKSLIGHYNEEVHSTGAKLYTLGLFNLDKELKRRFVDSLVDLISSSSGSARDNCLDVLVDVCTKKPLLLVPFTTQLKGLLDYIESFALGQIRKVFFSFFLKSI